MKYTSGQKVIICEPRATSISTEVSSRSRGMFQDSTTNAALYWNNDMDKHIGQEGILNEFDPNYGWSIEVDGVDTGYNWLEDWVEPAEETSFETSYIPTTKRHPHADLMIQYAENCELIVEHWVSAARTWRVSSNPSWNPTLKYRFQETKTITLEDIHKVYGTNIKLEL